MAGTSKDEIGGWAALADRFAEHFDVVLPDHRGHGRTGNPDGWMSFTQMGDDLDALIEHLDVGAVHLAGISDGGVMVLDQALRRPDTVLSGVIIGANYCVDEHTLGAAEGIDAEVIVLITPRSRRRWPRPRRREAPRFLEGPARPDHREQPGEPVVVTRRPAVDRLPDVADRRRGRSVRQLRPDGDDEVGDPGRRSG